MLKNKDVTIRKAAFNIFKIILTNLEYQNQINLAKTLSYLLQVKRFDKSVVLNRDADLLYKQFSDFEDHENIVVRAVDYINYVYAIPPLRGTYSWFDEMLRALLELSCPTIILDKERMSFLDDIEKGISTARKEAMKYQ